MSRRAGGRRATESGDFAVGLGSIESAARWWPQYRDTRSLAGGGTVIMMLSAHRHESGRPKHWPGTGTVP